MGDTGRNTFYSVQSPGCRNKVGLEANSECTSIVISYKGLSGEKGTQWHHGRANSEAGTWEGPALES